MTVWYAQAAGAIQSIEWDTAPAGGGTDLTWPPAADDVLCANGKAITWAAADVPSLTCARLSTAAEGGTAGGGFTLSGSTAVTITADITAGADTCVTSTHTGTGANGVTVTGNITGGSTNYKRGWVQSGSGTLAVDGDCTGGTANTSGLYINGASIVTVTGDAVGGTGNLDACGIQQNHSSSVVTLTGNITGGAARGYILMLGALTVYGGTVTGGSVANAFGLDRRGAGAVTINGNVTGGSAANAFGAYNNSTGAFTVIGSLIDTAQCSAYAGAIYWQPVAGVHYHKVFYAPATPKYYSLPPAQTDVRDGVFGGFSAEGVAYNGEVVLPSAGDVRLGVDFDYPGKETGTLALPAEADVKLGVGYGTNRTEYEGELVAGGGGVPLIGPGGLVG